MEKVNITIGSVTFDRTDVTMPEQAKASAEDLAPAFAAV